MFKLQQNCFLPEKFYEPNKFSNFKEFDGCKSVLKISTHQLRMESVPLRWNLKNSNWVLWIGEVHTNL